MTRTQDISQINQYDLKADAALEYNSVMLQNHISQYGRDIRLLPVEIADERLHLIARVSKANDYRYKLDKALYHCTSFTC